MFEKFYALDEPIACRFEAVLASGLPAQPDPTFLHPGRSGSGHDCKRRGGRAMISPKDDQLASVGDTNRQPDDASGGGRAEAGGGANLDKVRDILFGSQRRPPESR
jgi:hypothetical protein